MKRTILALPLLVLACTDPVSVTRTVDARPRILIQGAPKGSVLLLDGRLMGDASTFGGNPGVLLVEPGTHGVEVKMEGRLLLSQKVFLGGGELRTLVIPGEAP